VARVTHVAPDGTRRPLKVSQHLSPTGLEAAIDFPPSGDGCGGSDGNGIGSVYLFGAE
jgi:hypothetical protein